MRDTENSTLSDEFISGSLLPDDLDDGFLLGGDSQGLGNIDQNTGDISNDEDDDIIESPDDLPELDNDEETEPDNEEEPGEEADADPDSNEFYLRAQLWQEDGFLSPGIQLKKDMSQLDLENLYKSQIQKNAINQIKTEFGDVLKAKGVDPRDVFEGETTDEFLQREYSHIASLTFDTILERDDKMPVSETIRRIATEYWISKTNDNLSEEEVETLVNTDLDKYSEEDLLNDKYRPYFSTEAKRLGAKIKSDANARVKADNDAALANAGRIKDLLDKGDFTPEVKQRIKDALFVKNQVYDDGKGTRKVGISLYEKKKLEAENSIDAQFQMAVGIVMGGNIEDIKEKNQRIGAVNTMQKLAKFNANGKGPQSRNKKNTNNKSHDQLEELLMAD